MPYAQPLTLGGAERRRSRSTRVSLSRLSLLVPGLLALSLLPASANPLGEQVIAGEALITRTEDLLGLTITQGSDRAVINWADFSIGLGETTQFIQPGATSATLNRVLNGLTSRIDGSLLANGQVYLINPNGIIVGPSGRIDVHSFVGSTLDVSDESFMAGGDLTFAGPSQAGVVNFGTINAIGGDVFLIGRHVENHGTLSAPSGTVGLAAGEEVLLRAAGEERLFVQPTGSSAGGTGVTNTGTIQAATAELKATGNMYALAINNGGVVRATGVQKKGGRVFLSAPGGTIQSTGLIEAKDGSGGGGVVKVDAGVGGTVKISGKVDAAGADGTGGEITVLGDNIEIQGTAELNASGLTGGGKVLVGGDKQGENPALRNAINAFVDYGAILKADSYQSGNAGTVVVWSDDTTVFHGSISARAFGASGDGGFAEVSGKRQLTITGQADLRSQGGKYGSLLLDPESIVIFHSQSGSFNDGQGTISDTWIRDQLALGNVTIMTTSYDGDGGNDPDTDLYDIVFRNDIDDFGPVDIFWEAPTNLEFIATRSILLQEGTLIEALGSGGITLRANVGTPQSGDFSGITLVGSTLKTNSGAITLQGRGGSSSGHGINLVNFGENNSEIESSSGDITLVGFSAGINGGSGVVINGSRIYSDTRSITIEGTSTAGAGIEIFVAQYGDPSEPEFLYGDVNSRYGNVLLKGRGAGLFADILYQDAYVAKLGGDFTFDGRVDIDYFVSADADEVPGFWNLIFQGGGYIETIFSEGSHLFHTGTLSFLSGEYTIESTLDYDNGPTFLDARINTLFGDIRLGETELVGNNTYLTTNGGDVVLGKTTSNGNRLRIDTEAYLSSIDGPDLPAGSVTLNHAENTLSALQITGGDVSITNTQAITQDAAWLVNSLTVSTPGKDIILDNTGNHFGSISIVGAADDVSITDLDDIFQGNAWTVASLKLTSVNGDINLTNGLNAITYLELSGHNVVVNNTLDIQQVNAWTVTGDLELASQGNDIILDNEANQFGGSIYIQNYESEVYLPTLTIKANSHITQANSWLVDGQTELRALNGYNITANQIGNEFGNLILEGNEVDILDNTTLTDTFGAANAWNTGVTKLRTTGGAAIELNNEDNVIGAIGIYGPAQNVTIREAGAITQYDVWHTGTLTLKAGGAITLNMVNDGTYNTFGDITILAANGVNIREAGHITDGDGPSGGWYNTGAVTLQAQGSSNQHYRINLDNTSNILGAISILGTPTRITISENDNITQGNAWVMGEDPLWEGEGPPPLGSLILNLGGPGFDVLLDNAGNRFGDISINGILDELVIREQDDDITQGSTWRANLATLTAQGNTVDLTWVGDGDFNELPSLIVNSSNLYLVTASVIGQHGAWDVSGDIGLDTNPDGAPAARDITLTNDDNVLGSIFLWADYTGATVRFHETGDFYQGNAWRAGDVVVKVATGKDIYLNFYDNIDFIYNVLGNLTLDGNVVYIAEQDDINGALIKAPGGLFLESYPDPETGLYDITLANDANVLGGIHIYNEVDELTIHNSQSITQYLPGNSSFAWTAGRTKLVSAGDITLDNPNNRFGNLELEGNTVTIYESEEITADEKWVVGDVFLNSDGNDISIINEGNVLGAVSILGTAGTVHLVDTTTFNQGSGGAWDIGDLILDASGEDIHLDTFANEIGRIALPSIGNLFRLAVVDAVEQNGRWDIVNTYISAGGAVNLNHDDGENYNYLPYLQVVGASLDLVTASDVNQNGTWYVPGSVKLTLVSDGTRNINLGAPLNTLGAISILTDVDDVTIFENDAITQGNIWHTGNLHLATSLNQDINLNFTDSEDANTFGLLTIDAGNGVFRIIESDDIVDNTGGIIARGGLVMNANPFYDPEQEGDPHSIIVDSAGSDFGAVTITNPVQNLTLINNGPISQGNAWTVFGLTTLESTTGAHIDLTQAQNSFGNLAITAGSIDLRENGPITGFQRWNVPGLVKLNSSGNAIALTNSLNILGAIELVGNVPNFTLVDTTAVTQNGAWDVDTLYINSGTANITLNNAANKVDVATFTAGSLHFVNNQAIMQGGAWNIPDGVTLNSSGNSITLANPSNILGAIELIGHVPSFTLVDTTAVTNVGPWDVGTLDIDAGTASITLDDINNLIDTAIFKGASLYFVNNQAIAQAGAWTITGLARLDSWNNSDIILDHLQNEIFRFQIDSYVPNLSLANNLEMRQTGSIEAGATTLVTTGEAISFGNAGNTFADLYINTDGGALILREDSAITQSSAWTTGTTTLTAVGDITLDKFGNRFGNLQLTGSNVTVHEIEAITAPSQWNVGNVTLNSYGNAISLTNTANILGNVSILGTASTVHLVDNTEFRQGTGGAWNIGDLTLDARGNDIYLDAFPNSIGAIALPSAGNLFRLWETGNVTQNGRWDITNTYITASGAVTLNHDDGGDTYNLLPNLQISAGSGGLDLVTATDVNQLGAWNILGGVKLTLVSDGPRNINLSNPLNVLGYITLPNPVNDVTIFENDEINQEAPWQTGNLHLATTNNQNIILTATGFENYNVFGQLTLNAGNGVVGIIENDDIVDSAAGIIARGGLYLNANPVYDPEQEADPFSIILDSTSNVFGDIMIVSPVQNLTIVENGPITQSSAWTAFGLTTLEARGGAHINLQYTQNQFSDLAITAGSLFLVENSAITGFQRWNVTGNVKLDSAGNNIILNNALNTLGSIELVGAVPSLTLRNSLAVTQNGRWDVGNLDVDAGTASIILDSPANVIDTATFKGGSLNFANSQAIIQGGNWLITGLARLDAQGNDITLANSLNEIGQFQIDSIVPSLYLANNREITQSGLIQAGATTLFTTGEAITLADAGNIFGALDIQTGGGALTLRENDAITQSTAWSVGDTVLTTSTGQAVTLDNDLNVFGELTVTAGATHITKNNGNITGTAAWTTGPTTLNARGHDVVLTNTNNRINGALTLLNVDDLLLFADSDISQGNAWNLDSAQIIAAARDVDLSNPANTFNSLNITARTTTVKAAGNINQTADWNVSEVATIDVGTNNVNLTRPGNYFGSLNLKARNASVVQSGTMVIGGAIIQELLEVGAGASVTQTGAISTNTLSGFASNGNFILNHPDNKILFLGDIAALGNIDVFEDPGMTIGGAISSSNGSVTIGTYGGNLTIGPDGSVTAGGSNPQIILYTDGAFINNAPGNPLNAGSGRWLIYSGPGSNFGSLSSNFTQYSATYPAAPSGSGNGFIFAFSAPPGPGDPPPVIIVVPPGDAGEGGIVIPLPLDGQTGPIISQNPINDFSNINSGVYVQNEPSEGNEKEYEERYAQDQAAEGQGTGAFAPKEIGPSDGVYKFGSDGTSGIPNTDAPPELLEGLSPDAINEMQDAL